MDGNQLGLGCWLSQTPLSHLHPAWVKFLCRFWPQMHQIHQCHQCQWLKYAQA